MALVKKTRIDYQPQNDAPARMDEPSISTRDADALRRKARTLSHSIKPPLNCSYLNP